MTSGPGLTGMKKIKLLKSIGDATPNESKTRSMSDLLDKDEVPSRKIFKKSTGTKRLYGMPSLHPLETTTFSHAEASAIPTSKLQDKSGVSLGHFTKKATGTKHRHDISSLRCHEPRNPKSTLLDENEVSLGEFAKKSTSTKRCFGMSSLPSQETTTSMGTKRCYGLPSFHSQEPTTYSRASNHMSTSHLLDENEAHVPKKFSGTKQFYGLPNLHSKEAVANLNGRGEARGENITCSDENEASPGQISKKTMQVSGSSSLETVCPSTSNLGSENLSNKNTKCPKYKSNVRGVARGESLDKNVKKHGKFKILFLPGETVPISNDTDFSSAIGIIVRNHADIEGASGWQYVSVHSKEFCYARLLQLFDIEDFNSDRVQKIVDKKFQRSYTCWRNTLHVAYESLKAKGIEPRDVSPREDLPMTKWLLAYDFIEEEKYQKRSKINAENRAQMPFDHTSGRTPMLRRFKQMEKESQIEFFKITRVSDKRGGEFVNSLAKAKYDEMVEMRREASEKDGEPISECEIVKATLGHRSGYIKGMGHGLQVLSGNTSTMAARIDLQGKLTELDKANEKIVQLTNAHAEQNKTLDFMKSQVSMMQKIIEKLPGVPPNMFLDGDMDATNEP